MSFYITILFLVTVLIRPSETIPWLSNIPLYGIACLLSLFVIVSNFFKLVDNNQKKYMLGFVLSVICSNIFVGWFSGAKYAADEMSKILLLYYTIVISINSEKRIKLFLNFLIGIVSFLSISGIYQHFNGVGFGMTTSVWDASKDVWRVRYSGILSDPNDLAMVLVMIFPFCLYGVLDSQLSKIRRLIFLILTIVVTICIYFTYSRGGYLGLATAFIVIIALKRRKIRAISYGAIFAILFSVMLPSVAALMGTANMAEESAGGRVLAWEQGLMMLKSSPLFGIGFGRFTDFHNYTAHNSYVLAFSEVGIVGLFFFLGLLYHSLFPIWCYYISHEENASHIIREPLIAGFAAIMLIMMFLSRTYSMPLFIYLATAGCFVNVYKVSNEAAAVSRIFIYTIACILIFYIIVRFGYRG